MTASEPVERYTEADELVAELAMRTPHVGANTGLWPGLTIYRYTEPREQAWDGISGVSIGIVAQGRKAVMDNGRRFVYDQFNYLVVSSLQRIQGEVLEASPHQPCLCLVLQIEPAAVRAVFTEMREVHPALAAARAAADSDDACFVSALDAELTSAVLRFLRSLSDTADRRVLAPLYLRELVYRVLQGAQFARMLRYAARHEEAIFISAALTYIKAHLAEPLTVADLAAQVSLSTSAFTRTFRDTTGRSPYQFVKELRLDRARELLIEQRLGVADVASAVGYTSTSHFIKEFRGRFGATPRSYADAQSLGRALRAVRS